MVNGGEERHETTALGPLARWRSGEGCLVGFLIKNVYRETN